jgi:hypothetical protein
MVKRCPHTAIVTISGKGEWVNGEWKESPSSKITVKGHYDPVNNSRVVVKTNSQGNETEIHGEFFTHQKCPEGITPTHLCIDTIAIDVDIVTWENYQTHSIIFV